MNRIKLSSAILCLLAGGVAPSLRADGFNKETRFTINQPLQVQGTLLAPGQYVLKLTEPDVNHSIVSIYNSDGTRLEAIVQGWSAYRADAGDTRFNISQPQGNEPGILKSWFYPGENYGIEFAVKKSAGDAGRLAKNKGKGQTGGAAAADDGSGTRN